MALHPEINNDMWNNTLAAMKEQRIPHKESAIEEVLRYPEARLWNWKRDIIDKGHTHPFIPAILKFKLYCAIVCPLQVRGEVFGYFSLTSFEDIYRQEQLAFFSAVTDCIAVAVSNILANDEILERERVKTLQIEIGKALAEECTWRDRLSRCAVLLRNNIPYRLLLVCIKKDDNSAVHYGFYYTGKNTRS